MNRIHGVLAFLAAVLGLLLLAPRLSLSTDERSSSANDTKPPGWCGTGTGGLHVVTEDGITTREFPLKHTSVRAELAGPLSRVRVTQIFQNPYRETIEAIYVFPLPHEAAVNELEMRLGERVIRGTIERREEARRIYDEARSSGRVATLLEQERANVFTQSVANILPGSEIEVTLTYVETLAWESGAYEFVFPMVVGPRFFPGAAPDAIVPAGARPPGASDDSDRVNPPVLPPEIRSGHDIDVSVEIEAGVPLDVLESPTHVVRVAREGRQRARVSLDPLDTIPNKDFVLRYATDGTEAEAGVLTRHDGEQGWATVLVHPKTSAAAAEITPKEMIFVVDCSGSMSGEPIAAAKALVRHAIRNMNASDSFQIIRFSTNASGFSPAPLPATPENVSRGIAYIDRLRGSGGTHMIEGIKAALETPADSERLRIVMFLTDGYIGNENEILAAVRSRIGDARLFSFGVGSSVNRFLLDRMAEEGRGEVQYALPGADARREVAKFYERIRSPYLTDVELAFEGVALEEIYPSRIPDLFQGKPLVIHSRYSQGGTGWIEVRGRVAGKPWTKRVRVTLPEREAGNPALGTLWARAKIADLESSQTPGEVPAVVEGITALGLEHQLVTRYTSFVAVEEKLVVSEGEPKTVRVPVELPEGVSYEGIFGKREESFSVGAALSGVALEFLARGIQPSSAPRTWSASPIQAPPMSPGLVELEGRATLSFDLARPTPGLEVRITAFPTRVARGDSFTLEVTFFNPGASPLPVPDALVLGPTTLRLHVIDEDWNEITLGEGSAAPPTSMLAPGASAVRKLVLNPAEWPVFKRPGVFHLVLKGPPLGGAISNRVSVRIEAG